MKLPKIIPIFPLSNFIVFPKTAVPLNIFEPRYLEMVNESMKAEKFIGCEHNVKQVKRGHKVVTQVTYQMKDFLNVAI